MVRLDRVFGRIDVLSGVARDDVIQQPARPLLDLELGRDFMPGVLGTIRNAVIRCRLLARDESLVQTDSRLLARPSPSSMTLPN